ncbi:hypothetical protein BRADI_2g58465v3 [Brachypodium distachyon]|uniref:Uncharacterized protein n=1 Tax=Brachypodium distachyon TaxID=15368 RepID=A0A2K2DGN7_BRADI|nr:hypothetical protein BRADI_2g58465v3 [Brachypodium distachyon]
MAGRAAVPEASESGGGRSRRRRRPLGWKCMPFIIGIGRLTSYQNAFQHHRREGSEPRSLCLEGCASSYWPLRKKKIDLNRTSKSLVVISVAFLLVRSSKLDSVFFFFFFFCGEIPWGPSILATLYMHYSNCTVCSKPTQCMPNS